MTDSKSSPRKNEKTVLVLQGGGALGAYQAGVFEELSACGVSPSWVAGISIGAINAALIAGNPPDRRCERLAEFWNLVSTLLRGKPLTKGGRMHEAFNEASAWVTTAFGIPGFFSPRLIPPVMLPDSSAAALSYYDTAPLHKTLEKLVDFDLLNDGSTRLSVCAVDIESGNYEYFDTARTRIGPEHIMASAALPPGFPPVKIGDKRYWDGGIVSNTPLQFVLDQEQEANLSVFQVDVFSARGEMPRTIFDVYEREKEIRFSSRTRLNTDVFMREQRAKLAVCRLLEQLPPELAAGEDATFLQTLVPKFGTTIVHLIYRRRPYEGFSYDYEFSRTSVEEHWRAGRVDVANTLNHPAWQNRRAEPGVVEVLDLAKPDASVKVADSKQPPYAQKPSWGKTQKKGARQ